MEMREARGPELVDGVALLGRALRFGAADALPAWHVQDIARRGGVALGAFEGERLVGFSCAVPARVDGAAVLFSSGLAVEEAWRGRGVGRALKLAQREAALAAGWDRIDWTADSLAAGALRLYLSGLRARLVGVAVSPYAGIRDGAGDDVELRWDLRSPPAPVRPSAALELPWDGDPGERARVRRELRACLGAGLAGVGVRVDRGARRCWLEWA